MFNQKFYNVGVVCLLIFVSFISGCDSPITDPVKITVTVDPVVSGEVEVSDVNVGVVVSLTGRYADPYGLPMYRGFELARKHINASAELANRAGISFITADDRSTVPGAQSAVQSLVDQGVDAIVGIAISTQLKEAFPIAQEAGVVAFSSLSSAAGLSSLGDYIFRAAIAADTFVPRGVSLTASAIGYNKVSVIYDAADTYSTSIKDELKQAFAANSIEVLTEQSFSTGDTDFTAELTAIKSMDTEAVFVAALSHEMTEIVKQARAIGIPNDVHIICAELTADDVQVIGDAAEGVITFIGWSALSDTPGNQMFVAAYKDIYGLAPEPWAAQSYATLNILAEAIKNAGATDSASIRDALAQTRNFPTILGDFSFDANGEAIYDPIVLIVKDGTLQLFESSE